MVNIGSHSFLTCLHLLQLAVLLHQIVYHLVQVQRLHDLHLPSHAFQMIQSLHFGGFELDQLMLFNLLNLHLVFELVKYLVLGRYFLLCSLELLLEDLLSFLSFSKLFP